MKKNLRVWFSIFTVLVAGGLLAWWGWQSRRLAPSEAELLYEKNCAVCHGRSGDGKGEAAYLLQPKPRNFRAGKFRIVSSQNLQPTREDVYRTITNGMPGTAMPSWGHLSERERWELADYVLRLNWEGWVEIALQAGDRRAEAERYATEMVEPGDPIPIPAEPPLTPAGLRQGRQTYLTACANCHGTNGEGRHDPTWRTSEGYPTWSRNLRQGAFKGGREGPQLYRTFATGLPGTPMPSQTLSGEQIWRVVQYVQSLSDPSAQERARIRTLEISAQRVQNLPSQLDDPAWEAVPEVRIPLMPLWWHEGYIDAVRVKAVHDGERLSFRLEWSDPTRDAEGVRQQGFPDGAAVQLTRSSSPPLFAMGAPGEPVNIWHWKALWEDDRKQFQDVATAFPGMAADAYYGAEKGWRSGPREDVEFLAAEAVHNLMAARERPSLVEDANAAGLGTLTSQASNQQSPQGLSRWTDGRWRLQLSRTLRAADAQDVRLGSGSRVWVAFAVWDGRAGDRNGQKNVSVWNTLTLEK